jgi:hypothetical protein
MLDGINYSEFAIDAPMIRRTQSLVRDGCPR